MKPLEHVPRMAGVPSGRSRKVVYTCLFGYSEQFNDFRYAADGIDFVCFTDNPELTSSFWKIKVVPRGLLDPARRSKQFKALPHRVLPDYDVSLYIDNTVQLKMRPGEIFSRYADDPASSLVSFRHPWRDCVYAEAEAVISNGYDDPDRVRRQMRLYRSLGYPAHNTLTKGTFLLRRHRDPALQRVMESWHEQVLNHSLRDQLSLDPVMWSQNFRISYLPESFADYKILDWPVVRDGIRIPRDFDEVVYRELNPDVTIDCRKHYIEVGLKEGRRYK